MVYRIFLFLLIVSSSLHAGDWYVSTTGNDSTGNGSIGNPYATIQVAWSNSVATDGKYVFKNIIIRGGSYYNVQLIINGYTDVGNALFTAYSGESVTLYGGQLLTGWATNGDGTYTATLPAFPSVNANVSTLTNWQPRNLVADGVRVKWAQYPDISLSITNKLWFAQDPSTNFASFTYTNSMEDTTNNEFCFDNSWNDAQVAASVIDTNNKVITLSSKVWHVSKSGGGSQLASDVKTYTMRNGKEGMIYPNTFWWDKTNNSIVFNPPSGKQPNGMTVIVPTVDRMILLAGLSGAEPTNVCISNLTFVCTTAILQGGTEDDAGLSYNGAIHLYHVTNSIIASCTFYAMGGYAISTDYSQQNIWNLSIYDCVIHDCGSGGISLVGTGGGCIVSNNFIYDFGNICQSGVGICSSFGPTTITRNTISNGYGSGIYFASAKGGTVVSENWISRCVRALRDMGNIYTWNSTNNVVYRNLITDVNYTNAFFGNPSDYVLPGIYLDNYTSSTLSDSNIMFNCSIPILHYRCSTSNTFNNNILINPTNSVFITPSGTCAAGQRTDVTNTIIYSLLSPTWSADENICANNWTNNVFYTGGGTTNQVPTNAVVANPLFVKVPTTTPQYLEDADFSFQAGSPCPGLGIQSLSLEGIGYNGGLQHRPPDIKVTTLRVGNMRMSQ